MLLVVGAIVEADASRTPTFRSNGFARGTRGSNCVVPGTSQRSTQKSTSAGHFASNATQKCLPSLQNPYASERKRILAAFIAGV